MTQQGNGPHGPYDPPPYQGPAYHPPPPPPPPWWGQAPPWFQQWFGHLQPPRLQRHGITGGTFKLDAPDGEWKGLLRLDSQNPDSPWAANNDHDRTVYAFTTGGPLERVIGDETIRLGVALRFTFGIGNAAIRTIYNVPPNCTVHAAFVGQTVTVDAATIRAEYGDNDFINEESFMDDPTPIRADDPPDLSLGILQNQALALNVLQTPKRMVTVSVAVVGTRFVWVPRGAQSVIVIGDALLAPEQITHDDGSDGVPFPVNEEVTIGPGVWEIGITTGGAASFAHVIFGLGI